MYKILVVDDEVTVRLALRHIIDWQEFQVGQIFEAENGYAGLEVISREHPELIFVDIKMPGMTGLTFIEAAKQKWPDGIYVIISGYSDFEFAQQAIGLQVSGYLIKPINKLELKSLVERMIERIQTEKEKARHEIEQTVVHNITTPLIKEKIYSMLLEGGENFPPIVHEYKQLVMDPNKGVLYGVACLSMTNLATVARERFRNDHFSFFYAVTNVINELCSEWGIGYSFRSGKKDHEIIIVFEVGETISVIQIAKDMGKITEELKRLFGIYCIIGVGGLYKVLQQIKESYEEALEIVNQVNLLEKTDSVYWTVEPSSQMDTVTLFDKKELLFRAFESGSISYTQTIINEFIKGIEQNGYFNLFTARRAAQEFVLIMNNITKDLELEIPRIEYRECLTLDDLKTYMTEVIAGSFEQIHSHLKSNSKDFIYRIKAHIEKNFNKEISLKQLSEQYYLSKNYLTKLFKKEFEYGLYEYILILRMKHAVKLLKETNIPVQMIAEQVGYNDKSYFSKAFKNHYGVTPTEYRNQL